MNNDAVTVAGLFIYPVKSMRGIQVDQATLTTSGLVTNTGLKDREWMVVDKRGRFITQRQYPQMAAITPGLQQDQLLLKSDGLAALVLPLKHAPGNNTLEVKVWEDNITALDEGDEAAHWISEALETTHLRLVRAISDELRQVKAKYLQPGETAGNRFADAFPYLIGNMASLARYNSELEAHGLATVKMQRFRPNIVIKGPQAFAENEIADLINPNYSLALRKPCQRCPIINVNQATGLRPAGGEPLIQLRKMNTLKDKPGAWFGQNAILTTGEEAEITVGDMLTARNR